MLLFCADLLIFNNFYIIDSTESCKTRIIQERRGMSLCLLKSYSLYPPPIHVKHWHTMLPRYDVLSHAFRIPYFFALLGGCTVRQSSLLPRKPCGGGKILCFLSFPVRFSLRLPVRFRSFCSRFGSDVYRFWLAVLFFLRPAGRFLCVRERNREQITVEQKFISGCQRGRGCR